MTTLTSSEEQQLQQLKAEKPSVFKRLLHGAVMALAVQGTVMQGPMGVPRDDSTYQMWADNYVPQKYSLGGKRRRTKKGKRKHKKRTMKRKKKHGGRGRKRTNKRR